jgi:pseudouridine-5'-phosphate glycosidase
LADGIPVVALESAVITAGLPREPVKLSSRLQIDGWRANQPINLELARAMERTVRSAGAVPATVAVVDGSLCIGLSEHEIERLASDPNAGKAAITDLAHTLTPAFSQRERGTINAGTTVSATLAACALTQSPPRPLTPAPSHPSCIRVFATGGIGGVHRDWRKAPDISADLRAIASTPVCVVCSGAKSILDLPATLEMLEALNVPVLGYRTHLFPQFQSTGTSDLRVRLRVDDPQRAAQICRTHWETLHSQTGIVLANPVPEAFAVDAVEMTLADDAAERLARQHDINGPLRTPFLLNEIARLTENRSLEANLALLVNNARLAAEVAIAMQESGTADERR